MTIRKMKYSKREKADAQSSAGSAGAPAVNAASGDAAIESVQVNGSGASIVSGSIAQRLMQSNFNVQALRPNDVLRKDEWEQYDRTVVEIARQRLVVVGTLMSQNLTYNLTNALGTTVLTWEQISDMNDAEITMSGLPETVRDRVTFTPKYLPIPIVHKDFQVNIRALEASRRGGQPLDTTQAAVSARKISERLEKLVMDGYDLSAGGGTLYGFTNFPARNTGTILNWADRTNVTGEEIVADVMKMIDALVSDNFYGPYNLFIPNDYWLRLVEDYKANSDRTILERIMAIPGISKVAPTGYLSGGASGEVVMHQATTDVVDLVDGLQPTPVQWDSHGGFVMNFKTLTIMVPRMKSDSEGHCGIAHFNV